jgi:hypothetical protein
VPRVTSTALQIACCIERARIELTGTGQLVAHNFITAEIYAYTRVEAIRIIGSYHISFSKIEFLLKFTERMNKSEVYKISEPFWPRLAHPELLVREVLES